jgi:hypothetical protein
MERNRDSKKDIHDTFKHENLFYLTGSCVISGLGKHLKSFIYITSLAGMGLLFNSCMAGYIATEPVYVEYSRPPRPGNLNIWIDGDWSWNNQSHMYVQKAGYWGNPRPGQTFVSGHWQSTQHGKSWSKGHWQQQNSNRGGKRR